VYTSYNLENSHVRCSALITPNLPRNIFLVTLVSGLKFTQVINDLHFSENSTAQPNLTYNTNMKLYSKITSVFVQAYYRRTFTVLSTL